MKRNYKNLKKVRGGCQFGQEAIQYCETCLFNNHKEEDWNYGWANQMQVSAWKHWVRKVQNMWLHAIRKNGKNEVSGVQTSILLRENCQDDSR